MLTAIIVGTVIVAACYFFTRKPSCWMGDGRVMGYKLDEAFGVSLFLGAFVWFFITISIISIGANSFPQSCNLVGTSKLVAMVDNQTIQGRFYLMGGRIDGKLQYQYMIDYGNYFQNGSVYADKVRIVESNAISPRLERYGASFDNLWAVRFFGLTTIECPPMIITIPAGSITRGFDLDLQ